MGCTIRVTTSDYWNNVWKMCRSGYWATNYVTTTKAEINFSLDSSGSNKERKYFRVGETATFNNGKYVVKILNVGRGYATIEVWESGELEPDMTKAQIISNYSDKLVYTVGETIKSEAVVKNIGSSGTIYLTVGVGYIDSSNMIFLTGTPTTDQLFINFGQSYTFQEDVRVDITDYYRQEGIGWAYLQQQMFFLAGHSVGGDVIWDTERHITIFLDPDGDFTDPTSLDESLLGDIKDVVEDAIPPFGGIGGLVGVYDKIVGNDDDSDSDFDIMPLIYIGFAGLVGYLLIRSQ